MKKFIKMIVLYRGEFLAVEIAGACCTNVLLLFLTGLSIDNK